MIKKWKRLHRTLKLKSSWVTVYADVLRDSAGKELEYWHYERPDSVVVLAIHKDRFLLPEPQYRVGIDEVMLDFAGSRISSGQTPKFTALAVLNKELGIESKYVESLRSITKSPMAVDSSFSSQRLHGLIAYIREDFKPSKQVRSYELKEVKKLRHALKCVQCRLVLDEFFFEQS